MYIKILLLIIYSVTALNILKTQFKLGSFYQINGNQQDLLQLAFQFDQQIHDHLYLIVIDHQTYITSLNISFTNQVNDLFNYQVELRLSDGVEVGKQYTYKLKIGDTLLSVDSFYIPNKSNKGMKDVQLLPSGNDVLNNELKNYSIILIQDQDTENIYYSDDQKEFQLESIYYLYEYNDSLQNEQVVIIQKQQQNLRLLQQYDGQPCQPYGMRLTLGYYYTYKQDANDMMDIAFNTLEYCPHSYIIISDDFDYEAVIPIGEIRILNMTQIYENFTGLNYNYTTYINIIRLGSQNIPGDDRIYTYTIFGDVGGDSAGPFIFKIPSRAHNNKERRFMFFGDMDSQWQLNNSNYTFDFLQSLTNRQNIEYFDTMTFLGDMAYDLESNDCRRGDEWLRNISSFTAYYPFMVIPGNHDSGNNSDYPYIRRAFLSPKNHLDSQTYYNDFVSYDLGLVHFVSFNPDWIVYQTAPEEYIEFVYQLFVKDFENAQANRDQVPWIIVQNHYPMYCSDNTNWMCGTNWQTLEQFAALFTKYNVEVFMSAHQHSYERDSPFINNETASFETDGPEQHIIKNSNAPVYIIEGAAGNDYFMPSEDYPIQPYTIAQSIVDGVGVITVYNATHLLFEHIISQTGEVVDYVWVIQEPNSPSPNIALIIGIIIGFLIFAILICFFFFKRRDSLRTELLP